MPPRRATKKARRTNEPKGDSGLKLLRHGKHAAQAAIAALATVVLVAALAVQPAGAASGYGDEEGHDGGDEPWYHAIWPIGERHEVETVEDEYIPFAGPEKIPDRPALFIEGVHPFLGTGRLIEGFEVPILGAVWQPRLWSYFIYRTTFQSFNSGAPGTERETEWANRLDLFFNLQLTNTEKIILGLRPLDENRPNGFTRHTFDGANEGFNEDDINADIETLFFEGDLGSLVPNLDPKGTEPIDLGFTVGRQPIIFQEGILINDTVDAVGLVRNNIPLPYTSNFRVSALWAWHRLNRNDPARDADENMFGMFNSIDAHVSTFDFDFIYVDDDKGGDGFYYGLAAIQRLRSLGNISTAFRINTSIALDDEIPGNTVGNGTLFTAEISGTPAYSDDIVYFDPFLGLGNFTQAGREPVVGGPLANTGILFASPNLSLYGAEINPFTNDDVIGAALGYQAFWDNKRRNLTLEIAGKEDLSGNSFDSLGFGFQLQQAIDQYVQLQFEAFYTINDDRQDGSGGRFEVLVNY